MMTGFRIISRISLLEINIKIFFGISAPSHEGVWEAQRYKLLIQYFKIRRNQPMLHILAGLLLSKDPVLRSGQRIYGTRTVLGIKAKRKSPAHASKKLRKSRYFTA